jgi:hypothetical protein
MILFLSVIALSVLVGLVLGGHVRRFEDLRLRWWGLVVAGLGLQFVPLPSGRAGSDLAVRIFVLGCSYGLLLVFASLNVRLPGMSLVLVGLAMNAAVILPNGGMPVAREAIARSGQEDMLQRLIDEGAAKHHLMTDDDVLTPLADVIAIPEPVGQIVSLGDLFLYAGVAWLLVAVMRGRIPATGPRPMGPYHGKHRPGSSAAALRPPTLPRATTSGSGP